MKKILFCILLGGFAFCDTLLVGAGAGYKKPLMQVMSNLQKDGVKVDGAFANIKQITIQAKEGKMSIIVGDEAFLNKSGLNLMDYERIGKGALVLVTPKNIVIKDVKELEKLSKIAIPDPKKAIYGIRATEFLEKSNLKSVLQGKILEVSTVPQAVAYVLNGEVEAGFINSTEAIARSDEFGSIIYIDEGLYSPVYISAARLEACKTNVSCEVFINELRSERSKAIFAKFGLK